MAFVNIYRNINAKITASLRLRRIDVNTSHLFDIFLKVFGVIVVIASLVYVVGYHRKIDIKTLGVKTSEMVNRQEIEDEIKKTQAVLTARPDYVAAWIRLSVLYEQIGESDLAEEARERAKNLNRDL